jgi:hypothetical protein
MLSVSEAVVLTLFYSILFIPSEREAPSLFDKLPPINLPLPVLSLYNFKMPTADFSPPFFFWNPSFLYPWIYNDCGDNKNKQVRV